MSTSLLQVQQRVSTYAIPGRTSINQKNDKVQKYSTKLLTDFIQEDQFEDKQRKIKTSTTSDSFDPDSPYMIGWRVLNFICIYIYLFELPINVVFERMRRQVETASILFRTINIFCICIFLINMIVKIKLPYYKDGLLITDSKKILKNYFKYLFATDIIGLVPIIADQINENLKGSQQVSSVLSKISLLFYVKIFEIMTINKMNRSVFQLHRKTLGLYNVAILFLNIFSISNIMACISFDISRKSCFNPSISADMQSCWIIQTQIASVPILYHEQQIQYLYSLYWASTTMLGVGYGDIYPRNVNQVGYTIVAQYISCAIFAYGVNEVWQIFRDMRQRETKHQKQLNLINRYMRDRNVKTIVSNKVRAYLTHYYRFQRKGQKDKQREIIEDLAPAVKQQLFMDSYGCIFKFKIFENFSSYLFQSLVYKVQQIRYPQGQIIQSPDYQQLNPSIQYIFKGTILSSLKIGNKTKQTKTFQKQHLFGEYQFITGQITSTFLTTNNYCSVYFLRNSDFLDKIQDEDLEQYYMMKHSALYLNNMKSLNIQCYFCQSYEHITQNCCLSKILSNLFNVIKNYRMSVNNRNPFKRPQHRLVNKLVSRNEFGAIQKMIQRRFDQSNNYLITNNNKYEQMSLHESYLKFEPSAINFLPQQKLHESQKIRRRLLSETFVPNNKFTKDISMNDIDIQITLDNKTFSKNIKRNLYKQLIIMQGTVIDEIQEYSHYFQHNNISSIIKRRQNRKPTRYQRKN